MSKSPFASNILKPASSSSEIPSTSRTQTHEAAATAIEPHSPASSSPTFLHPSTSGTSVAGSSRIHPRESDAESDQPMTKHFRAESMGGRQSDRSSPSSDSQGGMADTEEGLRSERSPAPSEPPKKKRTRTLTTPHQSAVLHALLAQSRFPTTAMREEVGRAIGLSARKVQIWFQNQRQKARRPRTSNENPMTRPPQFGPFPSRGETEILDLYPMTQQGSETHASQPHPSYSPTHPYIPSAYTSPPGLPSGLLGPGVPGHRGTPRRPQETPPVSPSVGFAPSHRMRREFLRRSPSPPGMYNIEHPRPGPTHTPASTATYRDASRTLPPLVFPLQTHRGTSAVLPSLRSAPANMPPPPPSPFQPRSPRFAYSPPPSTAESAGGSSTAIPPPFTLEPQPQWDDPIFTSIPRTGSSSWSHHSSERGGSLSPRHLELSPLRSSIDRGHDQQTPREGRYDPVRASASAVPYYPPPRLDAPDNEQE
ncbi:hypothetical protein BDP27DRAFT_1317304 [Rhodocollybia butyracea]|uniref:Homeobox domain-containing protein n=1 Tax=Rhodocollybia butyracea TaxID=206335 RepID=A0A9P5Q4U0_9AGAR|nr:hypothetical protein BDP27DRAFT_1317304 [Rhodocollybia butyracea]